MEKNAMATLFYEQCCGTTNGHMAAIPNNAVLWSLVASCSGGPAHTHAATRSEFAGLLRDFADQLESTDK